MSIKVSWQNVKNRGAARLVFDKNSLPKDLLIGDIDKELIFATFGGCPVLFTHSPHKESPEIFLMKKSHLEWSQVCLAAENHLRAKYPEMVFTNKKT